MDDSWFLILLGILEDPGMISGMSTEAAVASFLALVLLGTAVILFFVLHRPNKKGK